ncbi:hypothetical protein [Methylocapsa sp. S129]|uniref:hypothetical protein n=1 Tax=Methylocapsa sp. S129 TaxID=1641869 RepID=UPI00131DE61A|nr:hypothetical protein [Methylocapsa sp. S129]
MARLDRVKIVSELNRLRKPPRRDDAEKSLGVVWLRDMLFHLSDPEDRYFVYHTLGVELRILGDVAGALECGRIRLAEFGDIVSRGVFARALLDLDRHLDAIEEFKKAFHLAAESGELINYTFGELMRAAVSVVDVETIDSVSQEFLALKLGKSTDDCQLEMDWMDAAEALGVRPELINELRHRAGGNS